MQRYTVLDPTSNVVDFILWDGNTATWSVTAAYGAGFTVRLWQASDQLVTTFASS